MQNLCKLRQDIQTSFTVVISFVFLSLLMSLRILGQTRLCTD